MHNFLVFITLGTLTSASADRFLPFSGFYPIPRKTPEPININTKLTYPLFTPQPLTLVGNHGNEDAYLQNLGKGVAAILKQNYTTNIAMGGPLGTNVYTYLKTVYHFTNKTNGVAYTTANGKNGSPLEVLTVYYNQKYKSYEESLHHRDGIVKISFRIHIGSKPNPAYEPFAAVMKKIQKPGSSVPIELLNVFEWYSNFPFNTKYFIYPGSLTDITSGIAYYCSTTIIADTNAIQYISQEQFESTFLKLLNSDGQPLTVEVSQHPRGLRPVARAQGILQKPVFNKVVYPSITGST